jgi:hypothetical protein
VGDQLIATPIPTQNTNTETMQSHPTSKCSAGENISCLRPHGHCDRKRLLLTALISGRGVYYFVCIELNIRHLKIIFKGVDHQHINFHSFSFYKCSMYPKFSVKQPRDVPQFSSKSYATGQNEGESIYKKRNFIRRWCHSYFISTPIQYLFYTKFKSVLRGQLNVWYITRLCKPLFG